MTTDHISPAGAIKKDTPGGQYLIEHGVEHARLQLLRLPPRQPRGDDARHVRQRAPAQPARAGHRGRLHRTRRTARSSSSSTPPCSYADEDVPLCVLAGKEYGSGSSRDWAAKGPRLLGIRSVIAESYERIHRSNLVGMGVLPLQFPDGESAESLGLTGDETFDLEPLEDGARDAERDRHARGRRRPMEFDGARAHRHAQGVAVLPPRRDPALRAAPAARPRLALSPVGPQHQVQVRVSPLAPSLVSPFALRFTRTFIFALTFFSRAMSRRALLADPGRHPLGLPALHAELRPAELDLALLRGGLRERGRDRGRDRAGRPGGADDLQAGQREDPCGSGAPGRGCGPRGAPRFVGIGARGRARQAVPAPSATRARSERESAPGPRTR